MNLNEFKDQNLVISKLIKISEPKENQKTIFVWPEGVILDSNLLKKSKFKELIKSNFSKIISLSLVQILKKLMAMIQNTTIV